MAAVEAAFIPSLFFRIRPYECPCERLLLPPTVGNLFVAHGSRPSSASVPTSVPASASSALPRWESLASMAAAQRFFDANAPSTKATNLVGQMPRNWPQICVGKRYRCFLKKIPIILFSSEEGLKKECILSTVAFAGFLKSVL